MNSRFTGPDEYPAKDLEAGQDGLVLVKLLIDPDGRIVEEEGLQAFSLASMRKARSLRHHLFFRPAKEGREKVYQEVVIPVKFSINRNAPRFTPYNMHYDHMWHHQQMIQNMNHITPPAMPSFR